MTWRWGEISVLIYHITSVDNLSSIIKCGGLWSSFEVCAQGIDYFDIAYEHIKDRRTEKQVCKRDNPDEIVGPGGSLADYVPFYFAPRSPMLFTISKGNVRGYTGDQESIIHLVSSLETVTENGMPYVFSDGHAVMDLSDFYDNLDDLNTIDWETMRSNYWYDDALHPDRKRKRQAEFLIHRFCPWSLISEIGVMSDRIADRVTGIIANTDKPIVTVHHDWYY